MKQTLTVISALFTPYPRAGMGLRALFATPAVQQFYNFATAHHLNKDKQMYQPGVLRKVSKAYKT